MSKEKKRKRKSRKGAESQSDRNIDVKLLPVIEFLHEHISKAICDEVFKEVRTNERQRDWGLFQLAHFWIAVILEAPESLSKLLARTRRQDLLGFLPQVEASPEAFFQRCRDLSPGFFMGLYNNFLDQVLPKAPRRYCSEISHLKRKFSNLVAIDGSRLDKIAHRLKILWKEEAAILPGCLTAVYDLFRGFASQLWLDINAASSEFKRGETAAECQPPGTLMLGDRLYCSIKIFLALKESGSFGLFRYNKSVKYRKIRKLSRKRFEGGIIEDFLVEIGHGSEAIEVRLIKLKSGGKTHKAMTSVLDTSRLSALDVVKLYPIRWQVERLFYDLKAVLNLKKFYAANPKAVAMEVYAAAIVHVAFRIAQADIAKQVKLPPEELSPQKLFPHLALVSIKLIEAEIYFEATRKANPGVKLRKPSWKNLPDTTVSLKRIRRQKRSPNRRKRKYSLKRRNWKSINKVRGAKKLT